MDTISRELIMQRWNVIQHELIPELRNDVGPLTPNLEKVIHTLEWVRIDDTELSFPGSHIGIYVSGKAQKTVPPAIGQWLDARA